MPGCAWIELPEVLYLTPGREQMSLYLSGGARSCLFLLLRRSRGRVFDEFERSGRAAFDSARRWPDISWHWRRSRCRWNAASFVLISVGGRTRLLIRAARMFEAPARRASLAHERELLADRSRKRATGVSADVDSDDDRETEWHVCPLRLPPYCSPMPRSRVRTSKRCARIAARPSGSRASDVESFDARDASAPRRGLSRDIVPAARSASDRASCRATRSGWGDHASNVWSRHPLRFEGVHVRRGRRGFASARREPVPDVRSSVGCSAARGRPARRNAAPLQCRRRPPPPGWCGTTPFRVSGSTSVDGLVNAPLSL